MSYVLSYGVDFVKHLQYVEGAAGTYATIPSSPTFVSAGAVREMTEAVELESINYRFIGSRDRYKEIKTGTNYTFSVTYNPLNETLMKYGTELPGGSGTIERDLQFLKSVKINGTEKYMLLKGARCNSIEISVTNDSAVDVTQEFICSTITDWSSTSGISGTPTYQPAPSTTPWTNLDGGSQPLRWNGTALDVPSFSMTVNNNIARVKPNGETEPKWVDPTFRDITFEFDTYEKGGLERADLIGANERVLIYHLTSNRQIRLTGAVLTAMDTGDNAESSDPKMQSFSGTATTATIESY